MITDNELAKQLEDIIADLNVLLKMADDMKIKVEIEEAPRHVNERNVRYSVRCYGDLPR